MADVRVTCITLSSGRGHEHITHIGSTLSSPPWKWTVAQVIESINANTNTFHVKDASTGAVAYIGVVNTSPPYLRTYADGVWNDNLLSLPQCPYLQLKSRKKSAL